MGSSKSKHRKMQKESNSGATTVVSVSGGNSTSIGTHFLSSNVKFRSTYFREEQKKASKSSQLKSEVEELQTQRQEKFRTSFPNVFKPKPLPNPSHSVWTSRQRSYSTSYGTRTTTQQSSRQTTNSSSQFAPVSGLNENQISIQSTKPSTKPNSLFRPFSELNLSKPKPTQSNITESLKKPSWLSTQPAKLQPEKLAPSKLTDCCDVERENVYKMSSKPRGYCLIIANTNFRMATQLPGNGADANRIREVFLEFNFIVRKYENRTAKEMRSIFKQYSTDSALEEHDAFVVFISTHGNYMNGKELFLGSDDDYIFKEDILSFFNNKNCPKLIGKPKIFLIDACRGGEEDDGIVIERNAMPLLRTMDPMIGKKVPEWSDILIYSSSVVGYVSWGSKSGSFFTNVLCELLKKCGRKYDLVTILEIATQKVLEDKSTKLQAPSEEKRGWTKKLYF